MFARRGLSAFSKLALIGLMIVFGAQEMARALSIDEASRSRRWLRLYQYQPRFFGGLRSAVNAERFFFSPQGRRDPRVEMLAAIEAFDGRAIVGTQRQEAGCVFPARKQVLEELLGRRFPVGPCPELEAWVRNVDADEVRLVFAGAYAANPGSILGHTFLRLANSRREGSGRAGADLLSYAVGFQALADGGDNRLTYMLKGLLGGYYGSYEIEKYHIKVGLYNNAEARDLWEVKVKFTPEEVNFLVRHFWELTFNARFDYFFIDENCAYRLTALLEAVRSEIDVNSHSPAVVLPAETVREMIAGGWAEPELAFRSSIRRRMGLKLALLGDGPVDEFTKAKSSLEVTRSIDDPTVLDALMDYWLFENYREQARLSPERRELMNAAFSRAAELKEQSRFKLDNEQIRVGGGLSPPFSGHKPRSFSVAGGGVGDGGALELSFRSGVHPWTVADPAYDEVAAVEYLGGDFELRSRQSFWNLYLLGVESIEHWPGPDGHPSWKIELKASNRCRLCETREPQAQAAFAAGFGLKRARWSAFALAQVKTSAWVQNGTQALAAPGVLIGSRALLTRSTAAVLTLAEHWWRERIEDEVEARVTSTLERDRAVFVRLGYAGLRAQDGEGMVQVGILGFF